MNLSSSADVRRCRPLLGTFVEITATRGNVDVVPVVEAAFAAIERVQQLMSFHDPASTLSRLNRKAANEPVAVDDWTFRVLKTALEVAELSGGAFDPTVAPTLQRWGILPATPEELDETTRGDWRHLELLSGQRVHFARPLRLDLGGIAKGFAVDCAVEVLQAAGVKSGIVNAGGDLRAFGAREYTVQLRDPRSPGVWAHELRLRGAALATSAPIFSRCESADGVVSHLVDPATGRAHVADQSVSVRAPTCLLADALTKVVLFGGALAKSVLAHFQAEAFVLAAAPLASAR